MCAECRGSKLRPGALRSYLEAPWSTNPKLFLSVLKVSYASRIICDTELLHPHDSLNTMYLSHLLLIYAKYVFKGHFYNSKQILHILRGSPCIHTIKSSIFQLNVSFNCVVNIYQIGEDCKCNQALSGFW
jgi:hypothetical protein